MKKFTFSVANKASSSSSGSPVTLFVSDLTNNQQTALWHKFGLEL